MLHPQRRRRLRVRYDYGENGAGALRNNKGGGKDERDGKSRMGWNPVLYAHHTCARAGRRMVTSSGGVWRKRGSSDVVVGDVGRFVNVGKAGVGGWTTLSIAHQHDTLVVSVVAVVVVVAGDVGVTIGRGPRELWRLDMRGLAVPPAGVVELVALSILIRLPRPSAMPVPPQRRLKRLRRKVVEKTR
ncbi:hypothetical protein B0H14DRAFT_1475847 [Mycena olivaceomarginata]|nr:hypothetical protein B0H14DRAFT_1475847 [Mycena olivaceomarginata]